MRPGQIRVFDGLRITTEHMNHFQGSLHSAIQDIREILGLGRVHYGFEVSIVDAQNIVVQPGLAFDFQKNRLIGDEPRNVKVTFEPNQETAFVCVKYDQIEEGQTEGHFTLIWDSCSIVLRPTMPVERDNVVPIAKLNKTADGNLEVVSLVQSTSEVTEAEVDENSKTPDTVITENTEKTAPTSEGEASPVAPGPPTASTGNEVTPSTGSNGSSSPETPTTNDVERTVPTSEGESSPVASGPAAATGNEPTPSIGSNSSSSPETPITNKVERTVPISEGEVSTETPGQPSLATPKEVEASSGWELKFRQGTVRLSDPATESYLSTVLVELLKKKLAGNQASNGELLFTISKVEVPVDLAVSSLTCQSVIAATLSVPTASTTEATPEVAAPAELNLQSTSAGEATFTDDGISQFAVSTIQGVSSELTERGIAHLPFHVQMKTVEGRERVFEMLKPLQLLISVDKASETSINFVCNVLWIGGATEEIIRTIEEQKPGLTWTGQVAWKAAGVSRQ